MSNTLAEYEDVAARIKAFLPEYLQLVDKYRLAFGYDTIAWAYEIRDLVNVAGVPVIDPTDIDIQSGIPSSGTTICDGRIHKADGVIDWGTDETTE